MDPGLAAVLFGTTNVGQRVPTPCFLMERFTPDKFVRLYPKKNNIKVEDDLIG